MLLGIQDNSVFTDLERQAAEHPSPCKKADNRTIYPSWLLPLRPGLPAISDLSEARFGESDHTDHIMPDRYRAPEVILGMPWSYPVDTWSLAMVVSAYPDICCIQL